MSTPPAAPLAADPRSWQEWRAARTAELSDPHGWLSLTALHWLDAEPQEFPGLPGRWWVEASGDVARADGVRDAAGRDTWAPVDEAAGDVVEVGAVHVEVVRRGGRLALRVRDPRSPVLAAFTGVPVHDHDPALVLRGRYEAFDAPREVVGGSVVEGLQQKHSAVGRVHVVIAGREFALTVFAGGAGGGRVLFRDATSGVTSTPSTRVVRVGPPAADGTALVDLNRAQNLPCAFTDFATCPLPPPENVLPVPVAAGERDPR